MSNIIDAIREYSPFGEGKKQPGRTDKLIAEKRVAGPHSGSDIRIYMDAKDLEALLDVAKSGSAQRVQLNNVGLHIRRYQAETGHIYECWSLLSGKPIPERVPFIDNIRAKGQ